MNLRCRFLALALLFAALIEWAPAKSQGDNKLTAEDKKYLDGLMKDFLFDPKGAERVTFKTIVRSVWASSGEVQAEGWLVAGEKGKPGRVYFIDGYSIAEADAKDLKKVDFVAVSKARFGGAAEKKDDPDFKQKFNTMGQVAVGMIGDDSLGQAAWLYRLGHEELAARALQASGKSAERLRTELAWSAFAGMVHAYMVRADEEALAHGERLFKLYDNEMKKPEKGGDTYHQAALLVEELKRRQKKGTFGKAPSKEWPAGFEDWDAKKKTAYLIEALEETDVRQDGQPGHVPLYMDRRVKELVRVGDAAMPALIEAFEKDERLTRCVHFWRDFARSRSVLSVREAILEAIMDITRVRFYQSFTTGGNFTSGGETAVKEMTKKLRDYWNENGKLAFAERAMKVLADPAATSKAKVEAAENLGRPDATAPRFWPLINSVWIGDEQPQKENPAVAKFKDPTAAEAILAALDKDPKAGEYNPGYGYHFEDAYLSALIELGDKRIAPELVKRAASAKTLGERRRWATTAHFLGEPKPFAELAEEFRAGKLDMATIALNDPEQDPLKTMVLALVNVGTPEADGALHALVDPKHPMHEAVRQNIVGKNQHRFLDEQIWFGHPFCLGILRPLLEDKTLTGAKYKIEKDMAVRVFNKQTTNSVPLKQPLNLAAYFPEVDEKALDPVAIKTSNFLVGVRSYHPIVKEADKRLDALKDALDLFKGRLRMVSAVERRILNASEWEPLFIPDIKPLKRAASVEDVKAGKAIFHLDGKGRPADVKPPAAAMLKRDEKMERPPRIIIVQAEVGAGGEITYGFIGWGEIRAVPASELVGIKSFADIDKEEKEAALKKAKKS